MGQALVCQIQYWHASASPFCPTLHPITENNVSDAVQLIIMLSQRERGQGGKYNKPLFTSPFPLFYSSSAGGLIGGFSDKFGNLQCFQICPRSISLPVGFLNSLLEWIKLHPSLIQAFLKYYFTFLQILNYCHS